MRRQLPFLFIAFAALLLVGTHPRVARAFGEVGAFDPRVLIVGGNTGPGHTSAPARWSWELVQRTSAPARLSPETVRADSKAIAHAPFLYLSGDKSLESFSADEIAGLRTFFALGGVLLVDDAAPNDDGTDGPFGKSARREISRVLLDTAPIQLTSEHVLFRSYYLLRRAEGRILGPRTLDAIVRGGTAQVIFSSHDIGGAFARGATGAWELPVTPGGDLQRERAIRLGINIAMYALCSNYKDDQVHAPFLMRRRAQLAEP